MVSKRKTGASPAGELVPERRSEKHPARRGATELQEANQPGASSVRAAEGQGFFSFSYSYKEISLAGGRTHIRAKEHRFEDGKLSSEEFEGTLDGAVYEDATKQAQNIFASQIGAVLGLFSALLPSSNRPKAK